MRYGDKKKREKRKCVYVTMILSFLLMLSIFSVYFSVRLTRVVIVRTAYIFYCYEENEIINVSIEIPTALSFFIFLYTFASSPV